MNPVKERIHRNYRNVAACLSIDEELVWDAPMGDISWDEFNDFADDLDTFVKEWLLKRHPKEVAA